MWSNKAVIYRKNGDEVECIALEGCHFETSVEQKQDALGKITQGIALLIVNGDADVRVGDLVGHWPSVENLRWQDLTGPAFVPVRQVKTWRLDGKVHHTEVFCGK